MWLAAFVTTTLTRSLLLPQPQKDQSEFDAASQDTKPYRWTNLTERLTCHLMVCRTCQSGYSRCMVHGEKLALLQRPKELNKANLLDYSDDYN